MNTYNSYKSNRETKTKKMSGGLLIGLFIGLIIGVVAAAAVVWYIQKTPVPFSKNAPSTNNAALSASTTATTNTPPAATPPVALPGKPGDSVAQAGDKPRFDFYKILPGTSEPATSSKSSTSKATDAKPPENNKISENKAEKETPAKETVYLQAGAFQNANDADNQKAKLAMMGMEASVQQVTVQDKVWYRVKLGPFSKAEEAAKVRASLSKQGVESSISK